MSVFQTTLKKMVKGTINAHFRDETKVEIDTLNSDTITITATTDIFGMDLVMFLNQTKFKDLVSELNKFQKTLDKEDN